MLRAPCSLSTSSKATSAVFGASDSEWLEPLCWNLRKVTGEAACLEGRGGTSSGDGGMENLRPSERALLPASGKRGNGLQERPGGSAHALPLPDSVKANGQLSSCLWPAVHT